MPATAQAAAHNPTVRRVDRVPDRPAGLPAQHSPPSSRRASSMATSFKLNGKPVTVNVDPATPILWTLRDNLGMTGTKFGCGAALCGACTVHLNGAAIRSCITPISAAAGGDVRTIEAQEA